MLRCICYSEHYHSWVLEKTNQHSYLMHNNSIPRYANINTYFVTLKYAVLSIYYHKSFVHKIIKFQDGSTLFIKGLA